jgi:hypothetical protein
MLLLDLATCVETQTVSLPTGVVCRLVNPRAATLEENHSPTV